MTTRSGYRYKKKGISIITCTKRPHHLKNIFKNFNRQRWVNKELIIILNNDKLDIKAYRKMAQGYSNVSVYQLSENTSLGACLNYAVRQSKYRTIAKFDDDDYYAPSYLTGSMLAMKKSGADIVGKRACYTWLKGNRKLILRFPSYERRYVSILPGATLVFKKKVFKKVKFPNRSIGEDDKFCQDSRARGYRVYSASKYNFAAIREKNSLGHTWVISDRQLLSADVKVIRGVRNYKKYVTRHMSKATLSSHGTRLYE
ncbi:glycosyltransferase family 2 protein [Paenibacillus guangzhouensis]|uniref:glycosyltransferase family 2 protein n=1 Tax=Paenibacillus guangzhouensis TaxID=1473112 RepID=UPI0012676EB3|nr:glycosyltransferase family A protein [Paenibacillus guangzhouensis]